MVQKNRLRIEMGHRPFRFSVENFIALAGLEVKLVQIWSQHGPGMMPKNLHSTKMGLRPCRSSVENFSALAGLEVKLGKHGPHMVQTWP